jgi:uncharacterized membrane protein YiaA
MNNSKEYVLESVLVSKKMIAKGSRKQDVILYLMGRNNTDDTANNIANLAMKLITDEEIKEAKKNTFRGVALSFAGIGISLATYLYTRQGGSYVVTYGIVIYGAVIIAKNIFDILDLKTKNAKWKDIVLKGQNF